MSKLDFIKKAQVAKEYSELDIARMDYMNENPDYYETEGFIAQGVQLSDIFESEKVNRNNEPYISRFARLEFYNDDEEEKISFPITFWQAAKDGVVKIKHDNPLKNLIVYISEDNVNNVFDVDYKGLQELIDEIKEISIKPKVIKISKGGFKTWGFDVVELKFKE